MTSTRAGVVSPQMVAMYQQSRAVPVDESDLDDLSSEVSSSPQSDDWDQEIGSSSDSSGESFEGVTGEVPAMRNAGYADAPPPAVRMRSVPAPASNEPTTMRGIGPQKVASLQSIAAPPAWPAALPEPVPPILPGAAAKRARRRARRWALLAAMIAALIAALVWWVLH